MITNIAIIVPELLANFATTFIIILVTVVLPIVFIKRNIK